MRYLITMAVLATALAFPLSGSASAQSVSSDVVARCAQAVGAIKFEGWPADRNRDMMMLACQSNGGTIPGAHEEKPVSLQPRPAPHR